MGIEPLTLAPDDPTWRACFAAPRGAAVRDAAAALQRAGVDTRTPAGVLAVVDAVAARAAADAAALHRVAPDAPPGDGGHPVDSPGAAAAPRGHAVDTPAAPRAR